MSTLTLPTMNGSSAGSPSSIAWLQSSVQEFFSSLNWDDLPPMDGDSAQFLQQDANPLTLDLSVSRFFTAIPWEGNEIAAAVVTPQPFAQSSANELTLEDFSDLFG